MSGTASRPSLAPPFFPAFLPKKSGAELTLGPIALRPVISGGLLIIISGWAAIAPPVLNSMVSAYTEV